MAHALRDFGGRGRGGPHSGPDTCPRCHPRGTWWLSAHTRASCRSGTLLRGRSCPCWKATPRVSVRSRLGARVGVCCRARLHPQPALHLAAGALAWNADQLSSGSRDRMILQRDIRTPPLQSERRLQGHRQEVCGLKWSTDHQLLASGGNDNKVGQLTPAAPSVEQGDGVCPEGRQPHGPVPAAAGVEPLKPEPRAAVHGAPGCRQGHRLVPPPARAAGVRGRHG